MNWTTYVGVAALCVATAIHAPLEVQQDDSFREMELRVPARTTAEVRVDVRPGSSLRVEVWGDGFSDFRVELRDVGGRLLDHDPDGTDRGHVSAKPSKIARALIIRIHNLGEQTSGNRLFVRGSTKLTFLRGGTGIVPPAAAPPGPTSPAPRPNLPAPPAPSPPAEDLVAFRQYAHGLTSGVVGFDYPPRLRAGDEAHIRLQVSIKKAVNELRDALRAKGRDNIVESVTLSPVMRADLVGLGFQIDRVGSAEQLVDADVDTVWSWNVVAKNTGRLRLTVTLTAIVRVGGSDRVRDVQSFHREVEVEATPQSTWAQFVGVVRSYGPPAELVWTTIATAIGGAWVWMFNRKRRARRRNRPSHR